MGMRDTHEIDGEIAYTIPQGLKNRCLRDFLYKIIILSQFTVFIYVSSMMMLF